mgnify:CR=1 FL=1
MRLRFCLDGGMRVTVMGTGVAGDAGVTASLAPASQLRVTPRSSERFVRACFKNARQMLRDEARRYLARFPPATRALLDTRALRHL